MSLMKKQTAGSWATFAALILALVSVIVYNVNISSAGYFQNVSVANATHFVIAGVVLLAAVIIMAQLKLQGAAERVVDFCSDIIRILIPAVFIAALMVLVSGRIEGFAFIYFSNEEVLHEVQTAANLSSAHGAIANIVCLAVTAVVGMIAAFFDTKKKNV